MGHRTRGHGVDIHLHVKAAVVVDAHIVLSARQTVDFSGEVGISHGVTATLDGIKHVPNERLTNKARRESIDRVPVTPGLEGAGVLREANSNRLTACFGVSVQDAIGIGMGPE